MKQCLYCCGEIHNGEKGILVINGMAAHARCAQIAGDVLSLGMNESTCCRKKVSEEEYMVNHGMCDTCMDKGVAASNARMAAHTKAFHQVCQCGGHHVYIDTISGEGTEFDSLNGLYCVDCNSFWREP